MNLNLMFLRGMVSPKKKNFWDMGQFLYDIIPCSSLLALCREEKINTRYIHLTFVYQMKLSCRNKIIYGEEWWESSVVEKGWNPGAPPPSAPERGATASRPRYVPNVSPYSFYYAVLLNIQLFIFNL